MKCDKSIGKGKFWGTYIRKGFEEVGQQKKQRGDRQETKPRGRLWSGQWWRNDYVWGCPFHLTLVFSVYLNQLTHFLLYLSLFTDYCEKAVTINFCIQQTNRQCFEFITFYNSEVTMVSNWNLKSSATRIVYLGLWCYTSCQLLFGYLMLKLVFLGCNCLISSNYW